MELNDWMCLFFYFDRSFNLPRNQCATVQLNKVKNWTALCNVWIWTPSVWSLTIYSVQATVKSLSLWNRPQIEIPKLFTEERAAVGVRYESERRCLPQDKHLNIQVSLLNLHTLLLASQSITAATTFTPDFCFYECYCDYWALFQNVSRLCQPLLVLLLPQLLRLLLSLLLLFVQLESSIGGGGSRCIRSTTDFSVCCYKVFKVSLLKVHLCGVGGPW